MLAQSTPLGSKHAGQLTFSELLSISLLLHSRCGAANHAIRLAKRGHTVYALDTSRPQLQYARRKAEVAGAAVRFMREDMFDFELPVRFWNLVTSEHSMSYFGALSPCTERVHLYVE